MSDAKSLRAWADDAVATGKHWAPVTVETLRTIADKLERAELPVERSHPQSDGGRMTTLRNEREANFALAKQPAAWMRPAPVRVRPLSFLERLFARGAA